MVLFGGTGDLVKRKLLPGLFHLCTAGFDYGITGVSLDDMDTAAFGALTRQALAEFFNRPVADADWAALAAHAEVAIGRESQRLHDLSVPPTPPPSAVNVLGEVGLVAMRAS